MITAFNNLVDEVKALKTKEADDKLKTNEVNELENGRRIIERVN